VAEQNGLDQVEDGGLLVVEAVEGFEVDYDPLNRLASQQVNSGATTQFTYLGLSSDLISETGGPVPKSYTYIPSGERISQTSTSGGTTSTGYYTYNDLRSKRSPVRRHSGCP
jgi:hypothetical protein